VQRKQQSENEKKLTSAQTQTIESGFLQMKLKPFKSALIAFATCVYPTVFAQDLTQPFRDLMNGGSSSQNKEHAALISQSTTGDNSIQLCQYRTQRGFTFAVNIRSNPCPRTVLINTQTMEVEVRNN